MKPSCRDVCDQASALLEGNPGGPPDGVVSGPEWDALRQHLAMCPPCGEYLRQMGLTVEALRLLPATCAEKARAELLKHFEAWHERNKG